MKQEMISAIEKVKSYGFKVYANPERNYFHFSDGKNIGYIQSGKTAAYALSILYVPGPHFGSSAQFRDVPNITKKSLEDCLDRSNYHWVTRGFSTHIKWYDEVSTWFNKIWDKNVKEVTYA